MISLRTVAFGALIYVIFLSVGALIGLILFGCLEYPVTIGGVPASQLTERQIFEVLMRDPNAMRQYTALVLFGHTVVMAEGLRLVWPLVTAPAVLSAVFAHLLLRSRRRRKNTNRDREQPRT